MWACFILWLSGCCVNQGLPQCSSPVLYNTRLWKCIQVVCFTVVFWLVSEVDVSAFLFLPWASHLLCSILVSHISLETLPHSSSMFWWDLFICYLELQMRYAWVITEKINMVENYWLINQTAGCVGSGEARGANLKNRRETQRKESNCQFLIIGVFLHFIK